MTTTTSATPPTSSQNQTQPPSPSPSPSQPPPPTTSLPPGPRATALNAIFTTALTHTLNTSLSYPAFSSCFPTPAAHAPEILQSINRQVRTLLREKCEREYEELCAERGVVEGLGVLEGLVEDAKMRKMSAMVEGGEGEVGGSGGAEGIPGPGTRPEELFAAHLAPFLRDSVRGVEEEMEVLRRENLKLVEEVEAQRGKVEALVRGLEGVVGDLEGGNEVLGGWVGGDGIGIGEEVREMEVERSRL